MDLINNTIEFFKYAPVSFAAANIILFILGRSLLAFVTYKAVKGKELGEYGGYVGAVVLFGVVGYVVFALMTRPAKSSKSRLLSIALWVAVLSVIANCLVFSLGTFPNTKAARLTEYYGFNSRVGIYEKENGEKIRYNNDGGAFTLNNMDGYYCRGKNGERYKYDELISSSYNVDEAYIRPLIDSKGFALGINDSRLLYIHLGNDLMVYADSDGALYYSPENCYYDEQGRLLFNNETLNKVDYHSAIGYLKKTNINYRFAEFNKKGICVFYDKLGKEYNAVDIMNGGCVPYYDREGNVYKYECDEEGDGVYVSKAKTIKSAVIDKDGFITEMTDDMCLYIPNGYLADTPIQLYYDGEGNIYYEAYDCAWNKNGELMLDSNISKITIEQIMEDEKKSGEIYETTVTANH